MIFRTVVRDCLYLNWALPADGLPALPAPLRYDRRSGDGGDRVFASAALFRLEGLHLRTAPLLKLSHPQFSLRLCVLDGDGLPAYFLWNVLIPAWAVPGARLVARQPARVGRFRYPRGYSADDARWQVRRAGRLEVRARPGASAAAPGAGFGSWERTVAYFLRRRRGYFLSGGGLRLFEFTPPSCDAVPLRVDLIEDELLVRSLPVAHLDRWPDPHSSWICPEQSFVFEVGPVRKAALPRQVPAAG